MIVLYLSCSKSVSVKRRWFHDTVQGCIYSVREVSMHFVIVQIINLFGGRFSLVKFSFELFSIFSLGFEVPSHVLVQLLPVEFCKRRLLVFQ